MASALYRIRPVFAKLHKISCKRVNFCTTNLSRTYFITSSNTSRLYESNSSLGNLFSTDKVLLSSGTVSISRSFSADKKLTLEEITEKVLNVCKTFDKIPSDKLTLDSHFMNDLGMDSLDHVELIMNIEDDFNFEISDADAEKLLRPKDIVEYISKKEQANVKH